MKVIGETALTLGLLLSDAAAQDDKAIMVTRVGSQPSRVAPAEYFTATVRQDMSFKGTAPSTLVGGFVTFETSARTAWHAHPVGQTLIVTAGSGLVQQEGGEKQEIKPGDVIWIPAGVKHWHGATATTAVTHIAINETLDGSPVSWMEKVTDEQFAN